MVTNGMKKNTDEMKSIAKSPQVIEERVVLWTESWYGGQDGRADPEGTEQV